MWRKSLLFIILVIIFYIANEMHRKSLTFWLKNRTARRKYLIWTAKSLKSSGYNVTYEFIEKHEEVYFRSSFCRALQQQTSEKCTLPTRRRHTIFRLYTSSIFRNFIASQLYGYYCSHGRTEPQRASTVWLRRRELILANCHILLYTISPDDGVSTKQPTTRIIYIYNNISSYNERNCTNYYMGSISIYNTIPIHHNNKTLEFLHILMDGKYNIIYTQKEYSRGRQPYRTPFWYTIVLHNIVNSNL